MEDVSIYLLDNSELAEFESISKGYRQDVYVKINSNWYNINVYDIVRLQQDFESEIEECRYYSIESNLVLVSEVSRDNIIFTVQKLVKQKYFEELKPIYNIDSNKLKRIV